jgi:hypothetical protein
VYLATGQDFPDALAGASAAGRAEAPLLLTGPGCVPAATRAEIDRLRPSEVVVLGGTASLSDAALSTPCPALPSSCAPGLTVSYEQSAKCLYAAFVADDRTAAGRYATAAVVSRLLDGRRFPTDDQWQFVACGRSREIRSSSGISCRFLLPAGTGIHGTDVEFAMRSDRIAEDFTFIG